jgi:hypothetical protein
VFARTFPGQDLPDGASFVDLGGDSLTYVQVAADIERLMGTLPPARDHRALGELESTAAAAHPTGRATVETAVLLRALAVVFVVGEHPHLWAIVGGAHLFAGALGLDVRPLRPRGRRIRAAAGERVGPRSDLAQHEPDRGA